MRVLLQACNNAAPHSLPTLLHFLGWRTRAEHMYLTPADCNLTPKWCHITQQDIRYTEKNQKYWSGRVAQSFVFQSSYFPTYLIQISQQYVLKCFTCLQQTQAFRLLQHVNSTCPNNTKSANTGTGVTFNRHRHKELWHIYLIFVLRQISAVNVQKCNIKQKNLDGNANCITSNVQMLL